MIKMWRDNIFTALKKESHLQTLSINPYIVIEFIQSALYAYFIILYDDPNAALLWSVSWCAEMFVVVIDR